MDPTPTTPQPTTPASQTQPLLVDLHGMSEPYESNPFNVLVAMFTKVKNQANIVLPIFGLNFLAYLFVAIIYASCIAPVLIDTSLFFITILAVVVATLLLQPVFGWLSIINLRLSLLINNQKKTTVKPVLKANFKSIFKMIGLSFTIGLIVLFGFIFFVIPGIYLLLSLSFAPYILVDQNKSIGESLSGSMALSKGKLLEIYGVNSVSNLAGNTLWSLAYLPLIGIIFILIILPLQIFLFYMTTGAMAYRYQSAIELQNNKLTKPPTHVLNIILLAAQVFVVLLLFAVIAIILAIGIAQESNTI